MILTPSVEVSSNADDMIKVSIALDVEANIVLVDLLVVGYEDSVISDITHVVLPVDKAVGTRLLL